MKISHSMLHKAEIEVWGSFEGVLPPVSIDTRSLVKGELFWALAGENFNGHDFVLEAFEKGASMVAVSMEWLRSEKGKVSGKTLLVMENTLLGLQNFARIVRKNLGAIVIGITGSYAKTTTREMIAAALATSGKVARSPRNFNNDIGLPLSIINVNGDEKFLVLEMGANHPGEIEFLCQIAQPDIGLITAIGEVHLEGFGDLEGVQQAKGELFRYLINRGLAVVNLDDERVVQAAVDNRMKVGYTLEKIPDNWRWSLYSGHVVGLDRWSHAMLAVEGMNVKLAVPGRHFAGAALAAFAVAVEAGAESDLALKAMRDVVALPGRGTVIVLDRGIEIMDESYNASVPTVEAALETLARRPGYKAAVLADMFELGDSEEEEHRRLGRLPVLDEIDRVFFVGPRMGWAAEEADLGGHPGAEHVTDEPFDSLAARLMAELPDGSSIVVKGSRAMHMDKMVAALVHSAGKEIK